MTSIEGKTGIAAHGKCKMPVRGDILKKEAAVQKDQSASAAKVKAIADYLSTIQR